MTAYELDSRFGHLTVRLLEKGALPTVGHAENDLISSRTNGSAGSQRKGGLMTREDEREERRFKHALTAENVERLELRLHSAQDLDGGVGEAAHGEHLAALHEEHQLVLLHQPLDPLPRGLAQAGLVLGHITHGTQRRLELQERRSPHEWWGDG